LLCRHVSCIHLFGGEDMEFCVEEILYIPI
jgi:hypothetical protein